MNNKTFKTRKRFNDIIMKLFRNITSILFLIWVIAIIGNIITSAIGLFFNHDIFGIGIYSNQDVSLNVKLIFIAKTIALLIFIFSVFILISNLKFLVQRDFFNIKLIRSFYKSGKLFLVSGIIGFIASIVDILNLIVLKNYRSQMYLNIDSKSLYIMLMILGSFFLLFSKVLDKGSQIQYENDLTI